MRCPYCHHNDSKVIDSRAKSNGSVIRRRRECIACNRRFTTKEYVEETPILVVKSDQRREAFNREKLKQGIILACTKRPISINDIEGIVNQIENSLRDQSIEEITSKEIGSMVMDHLRRIDQVAYVRFASVYRKFQDKDEFLTELQELG
ncbi:MAG: transcriptional regulator NrdR [candidate division KSB1 bacterium]|nr:transcriptional regulator NrdR [candidate division KSB1 bacterium]MDZ7319596.1 transcriptional regulator NrdR [candidate division KSB1 bacterium]MDZ7339823.1 transcriptional regulator NrdR [candidate division KSB1 bacterium]